jgi:hypothetical protein
MATLTTQYLNRAGLVATYASATGGGDKFTPANGTFLEVVNAGGSPVTVTVAATKVPIANTTMSNTAVSVAAGTTGKIGPFPPEFYTQNDGTGLAAITYSGVTSVTIAAINLVQP